MIRFSSPDFLDFNERRERRIEPIYLHCAVKLCKNNSYFFFFFPPRYKRINPLHRIILNTVNIHAISQRGLKIPRNKIVSIYRLN